MSFNLLQHFGIAMGQTVQDKAGHGRRGGRAFLHRRQTCGRALLIDARGHVAGKPEIGVIHMQLAIGSADQAGLLDQFRDLPSLSRLSPGLHTLP